MQPYIDIGGDSGVLAFETGEGWIIVQFHKGGADLYNGANPGLEHVIEMQRLAWAGDGLNTYINKHVRKNFAEKVG